MAWIDLGNPFGPVVLGQDAYVVAESSGFADVSREADPEGYRAWVEETSNGTVAEHLAKISVGQETKPSTGRCSHAVLRASGIAYAA